MYDADFVLTSTASGRPPTMLSRVITVHERLTFFSVFALGEVIASVQFDCCSDGDFVAISQLSRCLQSDNSGSLTPLLRSDGAQLCDSGICLDLALLSLSKRSACSRATWTLLLFKNMWLSITCQRGVCVYATARYIDLCWYWFFRPHASPHTPCCSACQITSDMRHIFDDKRPLRACFEGTPSEFRF